MPATSPTCSCLSPPPLPWLVKHHGVPHIMLQEAVAAAVTFCLHTIPVRCGEITRLN